MLTSGSALMASITAIAAWDKRWATPEGDWLYREPDVIALLPELKVPVARTALDLGCGVDRQALFLADHGLAVEVLDGSAAGLAVVREMARARGLSLGEQPMRCRSTMAASTLCCRGM
jgi:hypothetical protein